MITKVWLKSQPKKEIAYPDCFPVVTVKIGEKREIKIVNDITSKVEASYDYYYTVSRFEFRPS